MIEVLLARASVPGSMNQFTFFLNDGVRIFIFGAQVTIVDVDSNGVIDMNTLGAVLNERTAVRALGAEKPGSSAQFSGDSAGLRACVPQHNIRVPGQRRHYALHRS